MVYKNRVSTKWTCFQTVRKLNGQSSHWSRAKENHASRKVQTITAIIIIIVIFVIIIIIIIIIITIIIIIIIIIVVLRDSIDQILLDGTALQGPWIK